jgi:hypothetical protein
MTLEGIYVEALVVPIKVFVLECALELTSLCIVRGNDPIGFAQVLEVPSKKHNRFDFFLVLKMAQDAVSIAHSITSAALTNGLFPSSDNCSQPSTSTNRQAMALESTT